MEFRQFIGKIQSDAAIGLANRLHSAPDHLSSTDQRVETAGLIGLDAGGQNFALNQRCWKRCPLQLIDCIEYRIQSLATMQATVPVCRHAGQRMLLGWLNLFTQPSQRFAANRTQHLSIAPFAMHAAGTEVSFDQPPSVNQCT